MLVKQKKLKYGILAVIFMVLAVSSGVFLLFKQISSAQEASSGADSTMIAELNRQIDEQRAKIDALAVKMEEYKQNLTKARSQSTTLQNQIYIINNQITKAELDIQAKEEEIKTTEMEIEKLGLEVKENELKIQHDKLELEGFLRLLDRYDKRSYLSVLLGNNSFSEFFDQIKYSQNISEDLQKTLNRVQELVENLNKQKTDQEQKQKQLADLLDKLEGQKLVLGDQKDEKGYLMAQTKSSESKFQNLVTNIKKDQAAANAAIAGLERKIRAELEKKGGQEKFNQLGDAVLAWPTSSQRITAYFHDPDYPYRNLFEHSGLDIGVGMGTPVRAAEDGYVAKVAVGTKWYGTYIMIIHNNSLSTLYAHLSSAMVATDQYVSKGQTIGLSGSTGFSSGPHLHFEVRANGIPVNPLSYLP